MPARQFARPKKANHSLELIPSSIYIYGNSLHRSGQMRFAVIGRKKRAGLLRPTQSKLSLNAYSKGICCLESIC